MEHDNDQLMTPAEVAEAFRVDTATVTRWARAGLLNPVFTLGGHRRYRVSEINERLQ
ncbi:BldC family transcriptional regulator [Terrabacter sp. NPDC000476]|uniref:BldC family transcriptional regulator n=1 Tax=Terrabacter sp. NPDC000476 TaxID=3154258 RepID=UPI00331D85D5